jgi:hypothetical protein
MANEAWNHRRTAAKKYQPKRVRLLLVAESPPAGNERYFYFEDADSRDPLFEEVCAVLFEAVPDDKVTALKELRRRGVFVAELKPDAPRAGESLTTYVTPFLLNLETYAPEKIVLLGADVYAALQGPMNRSELPVVDAKVPSPDAGVEFRQKLRQALVRGELEKLIRPLKKKGGE